MIRVTAKAHPNIAFIKYWGKIQNDPSRVNWALNPSLSMTLKNAQTLTSIEASSNEFEFFLNGSKGLEDDSLKVRDHLKKVFMALQSKVPLHNIRVSSQNNFPTSAGIASSASGFCALTLVGIAWALEGQKFAMEWIAQNPRRFSEMCRWGSGSACRSTDGPFMFWENEAATKLNIDFQLFDTIVIFSKESKLTSSRMGHIAANESPLLAQRLKLLPERTKLMKTALQKSQRDPAQFLEFGKLLEEEALEMHQVSRATKVEYWMPATKIFIEALQQRDARNFFFTIDAGPNVHLISTKPILLEVSEILNGLNLDYEIWEDQCGEGPQFVIG